MTTFPEEIIKRDIVEQLVWDNSVNANDIHVEVQGNTVQLKGTVPNYTAKLAAERNAYKVQGVLNVESYISVAFPPHSTLPDDDEITENIKNMLAWNNKIKNAGNISVETNKGVVTLSGRVTGNWENYEAAEIANATRGVVDVVNKISIRPVKTLHDLDIEKDIRKAYKRSILIDENKIEINVKESIVYLTGTVANHVIKNEAYKTALHTSGVIDVIDNVTIK